MKQHGYYRFPTIHNHRVVFVSEDDLWSVSTEGGTAHRLTANLAALSFPCFSPDGKKLAFTGREEGHNEVYVMDSEGGPLQRLTYLGVTSTVLGWTPDGQKVLFATDSGRPFDRIGFVQAVGLDGGLPEPFPVGHAVSLSIAPDGRVVLARNNNDPARWKRYRGGRAGDIWIDANGDGNFRRLLTLEGNLTCPLWIGDRIYFLSDHEGVGNLYSCTIAGEDLQRHTHHKDFYVRFPKTDGSRIVYQAGADLYVYEPKEDRSRKIAIAYASPRVQRQRKFVEIMDYLESYEPHPSKEQVALTGRGKSFTLGCFEGPVTAQENAKGAIRLRLARWLNDGERVVVVANVDGREVLEVHHTLDLEPVKRFDALDIGRPYEMIVSPKEDVVAIANHRNELLCVQLEDGTLTLCDRSDYGAVRGMDWSPDGKWLAYGLPISPYRSAIRLWNKEEKTIHEVTDPTLAADSNPSFDPDGKFLYFISAREFTPVPDSLQFELSFPMGMRPYLVTLQADRFSPFWEPLSEPEEKREKEETKEAGESASSEASMPLRIDLEGIQTRVIPFPVPEGIYGTIVGITGKVLFLSYPVVGEQVPDSEERTGSLECYDFKTLKKETLLGGVKSFRPSRDRKRILVHTGKSLRLLKAGEKPDEKAGAEPGRQSGILALNRVRLEVDPPTEWRQMLREAWQLQKEFFWTEDLSGVEWDRVWERYAPLVDRMGTRGELSDLIWEMQGELGTSHAYEFGGDYRKGPEYPIGFLGADFRYDPEHDAYRIVHIVRGTTGDPKRDSPLRASGVNIREGDLLIAIDGQRLSAQLQPNQALVHRADSDVVLTVQNTDGERRNVRVHTLRSEFPARYREWVEANRRRVHEATNGRVGYVHIPDMGLLGFAEFHRLYLVEVERDGLIVDVRFNRGGFVSQLIIEKLARKRVGYDLQRWGAPEPYPQHSVAGPIVALTNQWAGSDGDIFSHVFKLMKLGPLIGKRTWGGVIGIWPRMPLADGTITTQPEFSFWFQDVGWRVENYGTDPDIEVDVTPQDYVQGKDPQLEKGIEVILKRLEESPPIRPDFKDKPKLPLPS